MVRSWVLALCLGMVPGGMQCWGFEPKLLGSKENALLTMLFFWPQYSIYVFWMGSIYQAMLGVSGSTPDPHPGIFSQLG